MSGWWVLAWALGGAAVGAAGRVLLGRLRRGAVVRPGPVELAAAVVCGLAVEVAGDSPLLALVLCVGLLGVLLSAVDLAHHRLPDALTIPGAVLTTLVVVVTALLAPAAGSLPRAGLAVLVVTGAFAALALAFPAGMGWGDVKLTVSLAAATGFVSWETVLVMLLVGCCLAGVVAVGGIALRRLDRRSAIALGPYLCAGAYLSLLAAI